MNRRISEAVEKARDLENERHLIENSKGVSGVYWIIDKSLKLCKFGSSNNIYRRMKDHKSDDFKNFILDNVMSSLKYSSLENRIRPYANNNFNGHTEIIAYTDYSQIEDIYKVISKENKLLTYDESNELELEKIKLECKEKDNENLRLQIELKKLEISERNTYVVPQIEFPVIPEKELIQINEIVVDIPVEQDNLMTQLSKATRKVLNKVVNQDKSIKCSFCNEEFSRKGNLNRHLIDKRCKVDLKKLHTEWLNINE
jgi:acylphosphatase